MCNAVQRSIYTMPSDLKKCVPSEADLKASLLNALRKQKQIDRNTILANELPLGTTGVRADLAFLTNEFCGIEIKSDRDSLRRLEKQIAVYCAYFDRVILVLGNRHAQTTVLKDTQNVELWTVSEEGGLSLKRSACAKYPNKQKNSLLNLLNQAQLNRFTKGPTSENTEREAFFSAFRGRFDSTSEDFWASVKGKHIKPDDLKLLSRFEEKRQLIKELQKHREDLWTKWQQVLDIQSTHSSSVS